MKETENYLKLFLSLFFFHIRLIFFSIVIFSFLAMLVAFVYPKIYLLSGELIVKSIEIKSPPESVSSSNVSRHILPPSREDTLLESNIIKNPDLIRKSILQLHQNGKKIIPEKNKVRILFDYYINKIKIFMKLTEKIDKSQIDVVTDCILEDLSATIIPGSNIIKVELYHSDPVIGSNILNAIFDNYLEYRLSLFIDPLAGELFSDQIKLYKKTIETLKSKEMSILDEYAITNIDKQIEIEMSLLSSSRKTLFEIKDEFLIKKRGLDYLKKIYLDFSKEDMDFSTPFSYDLEDRNIISLYERMSQQFTEYTNAKRVYNENFGKIQSMKNELKEMHSQLTKMIKKKIQNKENELHILQERIASFEERIEKLNQRAREIRKGGNKLSLIDTDIRLHQENYEVFLRKFEEARIEATSETAQRSNIQVLNRSHIPETPFFPKKKIVIPIGVLIGILMGFSLAFVVESFDHRFKSPADVKKYLDLPVIVSIPKVGRK